MEREFASIKARLEEEKMEVVVCHNDCWRENILYDQKSGGCCTRYETFGMTQSQVIAALEINILYNQLSGDSRTSNAARSRVGVTLEMKHQILHVLTKAASLSRGN